jgi:hypothetical protein
VPDDLITPQRDLGVSTMQLVSPGRLSGDRPPSALSASVVHRRTCHRRSRRAAPVQAAQCGGGSGFLPALKEWAPTCAAISTGEQTILLRKGGIKEPTFKPVSRDFLLFPTSFHTDAEVCTAERLQAAGALCRQLSAGGPDGSP